MQKLLLQLRYYLEFIALPAFVYLVIHLSGHGVMVLLEGVEHTHEAHEEGGASISLFGEFIEWIFTVEVLSGILLLILFTWLWHRPAFKKWVPCSHEHCHGELKTSHFLAIAALCLHFFPEAGVRTVLLRQAFAGEITTILGLIGFAAHFLVDVIVAFIISSYFSTRAGFWLSLSTITLLWILALFVGEHIAENIPASAEGLLFLISAFLLAMFVHWPHRAKVECEVCEH